MTKTTPLLTNYQRILDSLSSAVLLVDEQLRLEFMNPAAEALFQASARHMIGQRIGNLIQGPEGVFEASLKETVTSGRPFTERELVMPLIDGRRVTVDCTAIPLNDDDGYSGLLIEIQQIDRQLRISREEYLLAQNQAAQELIRGLAHEIKNPLGGLRGAAQLLEQELPEPDLREYTQIIIDEADRLKNLVNRMLGPNRLPALQRVNIHTLLERVRNLVLAESREQLHITRDYDPSIPELFLDSDRIIQALLNVLRNAAREVINAPAGQIVLSSRILRQFTIGHERHRLVAHICVKDNGPGIPEPILEKIFYPMVTASEGGIGLGLSIAQSLINQHGGLIECKSKPGETIFSILLPVENPNA